MGGVRFHFSRVQNRGRGRASVGEHVSEKVVLDGGGEFQGKKIEVPLFGGEKYRFVFSTKGANKNFQIYISNKKDTKSGKFLYSLKEHRKEGKDIYIFEPEKAEKLYITYIVPPSLDEPTDFCAAFMIGYKL